MALSIIAGHEQTIYQAAQWRAELDAALRSGEDILLDLSAIEEIDCAGARCCCGCSGKAPGWRGGLSCCLPAARWERSCC